MDDKLVRIDAELHRRAKAEAAWLNMSLRDWLEIAVKEMLSSSRLPLPEKLEGPTDPEE